MDEELTLPISPSTNLNLEFGDLFKKDGYIVIPVNEYFYTEIGRQVASTSLHGKFIEKFFNNAQQELNQLIEEQIKLDSLPPMVRANDGRNMVSYPIGTTLAIEKEGRKFLLCVLSKTNENFEAYATLKNLGEAIEGACNKARMVAGGLPVSFPIIGAGLSRVCLKRDLLISELMLNIFYYNRERMITNEINIVIFNDPKFPVNLEVLRDLWD